MTATKHPGPDWDIDLAFGEDAERSLIELFNAINKRYESLEVKNESRQALGTGNVFIEFEQTPRGQDAKPSGIATSKAGWYALHFQHVVVLLPTKTLRRIARKWGARHPDAVARGGTDGDNPTRGVKVPITELLRLANEEPFEE